MYLILEKKQTKVTATEGAEILSKVVVYPNPFSTSFELSFNLLQTTDVTASIYNLSGNRLYIAKWDKLEQGTQHTQISLNAPSGYYLLRLTYGQETKTLILIKN
jgi:hypothetical protein